MEKSKKNLKITSYVIIVLAIVNILFLGIGYANGQLKDEIEAKIESMKESGSTAEEIDRDHDLIYTLLFNGTLVGVGISTLLYVYLGIKGLRQSEEKGKGKGNIVWAKLLFVLGLMSVIMSVISLTNGQISASSFVSSLASLVIIYYYMKYAKEVVEPKEEAEEN